MCAQVPAYARFINERFERCLDLYLAPRARRKRAFVKDAKSLVPALPRPRDLQPFPCQLAMRFLGHSGPVRGPSSSCECSRPCSLACALLLPRGLRNMQGTGYRMSSKQKGYAVMTANAAACK
jgi:hypothetical protein